MRRRLKLGFSCSKTAELYCKWVVGTVNKRGNGKALLIFVMLITFVGVITASSFNDTSSNSTFLSDTPDNSSATILNMTGSAGINATGNETSANQTPLPYNYAQNLTSSINQSNTSVINESQTSSAQLPILPAALPEDSILPQNVTSLPNQTGEQALNVITNLSARNNQTPQLARKVSNISIDTPYVLDYLKLYKNFSSIQYERMPKNSTVKTKLAVGAKEDNIRGFEMGYDRYAIHLILCNHNTKTCAFRINGVATGALSAISDKSAEASSKFDLDENATLEVTGIQLDYCDGRRFCNVYYEAYDIVNLTVITK